MNLLKGGPLAPLTQGSLRWGAMVEVFGKCRGQKMPLILGGSNLMLKNVWYIIFSDLVAARRHVRGAIRATLQHAPAPLRPAQWPVVVPPRPQVIPPRPQVIPPPS